MPEITMPRLSDTMEDGVIAAWLKKVGDQVAAGEVIAEIETDKALMELEAYEDGVLEQILAEAGTRVPIGEPIGIVGDGSGAAAPGAKPAPAAAASGTAPAAQPVSATQSGSAAQPAAVAQPVPAVQPAPAAQPVAAESAAVPPSGDGSTPTAADSAVGGERKKSSPLARKIAGELGVELSAVTGTGPGGRITRQDVESAAAALASAPAASAPVAPAAAPSVAPVLAAGDYDEVALTTIQQVSAKRLTESKQQAPHIYLTSAIDVTDLLEFRTQLNRTLEDAGKGKVSVNDLLVKAVATTLRTDPSVNVSFAGDKLLRHKAVNLGIAVATPAGLLVPVIHDADRKSVSEISAESRDKATRARDRKLRGEDMSGGTFTISNLGMFGIEQFTAVINPPESAILAVGAAQDELRPADGEVIVRKILRVTLSADHRAIDGAVAAKFLQQLRDLIEHPLRIVA